MAINEEARIPVYINDEQARAALKTLQSEAEKLRKAMVDALAANDMTGYNKAAKELKKVTNEANNLKKASFDVNKVIENLKSASVNDLRKALMAVKKEQSGLNRDTKEYIALQNKANLINGELKKVNGTLNQQKGIMGNLIGSVKGLLPAFSFGAIVAGAQAAFQKIVASTDYLSDKWDEVMGSMTAATDYFWTTLASGDWNNFFTNLVEATRLGAEYARTLDAIGDRQRALSIDEANAQQKILDLEVKMRNKTLSNEERLAAGQERIKLEEQLAASRTKNAQMAYDNEVTNNIKLRNLSKEQTMQILTDLDSQERKEAEVFAEKMRRLAEFNKKKGIAGAVTFGAGLLYNNSEMKQLSEDLAKMPADIQKYGKMLFEFQNLTDEEKDKIVKTYVELKDAQNSAVENTKKVRNQVNTLLAADQKEDQKEKDKAPKAPERTTVVLNTMQTELDTRAQLLAKMDKQDEAHLMNVEETQQRIRDQYDQNIAKYQQELEARQEIGNAIFDISQRAVDALIELAGKESTAGKALFLLNQARAVGEVIFNTAIANAKAVAAFPITAGMPWVAINTASAGVSIASILAQTISTAKGFAEGGYTGPGGRTEAAGVVHKGEYVVPASIVNSPSAAPVISWLEKNRLNGGMMNTSAAAQVPSTNPQLETAINQLIVMVSGGIASNEKLMEWKPKVYTELIKKDLDTLDHINKNRNL